MKRGIITNHGHGIHISDGEVWMTSWEIADLFYTTAGSINAAIKVLSKHEPFKGKSVCSYRQLENGYYADTYNLEMVIALSFHFDTGHALQFRQWIISKVTTIRHKESVFIIQLCGNYPSC